MASEHGMTIGARSATYADAGMGGTAPKTKKPAAVKRATGKAGKGAPLRTIDLFCGAGGITVQFVNWWCPPVSSLHKPYRRGR